MKRGLKSLQNDAFSQAASAARGAAAFADVLSPRREAQDKGGAFIGCRKVSCYERATTNAKLGEGTFGDVYKATDKKTVRPPPRGSPSSCAYVGSSGSGWRLASAQQSSHAD